MLTGLSDALLLIKWSEYYKFVSFFIGENFPKPPHKPKWTRSKTATRTDIDLWAIAQGEVRISGIFRFVNFSI